MEQEQIFQLMARFEKSSIAKLKLEEGDFSIELEKAAVVQTAPAPVAVAVADATAEPAVAAPVGEAVKAPLVGTFYAAPAPDKAPFVIVGQTVAKGDTLCLIEAMKTMNEIKAPCDLVVEEILVKDGDLVAFGGEILRYSHV